MFYALEMALNERDVLEALTAACAAVAPGLPARIDARYLDGSIEIAHDGTPTDDLPYAIARHLRGGRDFDPDRPSEWHVRSVGTSNAGVGADHAHVTTIALCQSLQAPRGYTEPAGASR